MSIKRAVTQLEASKVKLAAKISVLQNELDMVNKSLEALHENAKANVQQGSNVESIKPSEEANVGVQNLRRNSGN